MAKNKINLQSILVFTMLVILPAGSWYYLQKGLDYQKGLRAELGNYGSVPKLEVLQAPEKEVDETEKKAPKPQLSIYSFITSKGDNSQLLDLINRLNTQFEDTRAISIFVGDVTGEESFPLHQKELADCTRCRYLSGKDAQSLLQQSFRKPLMEKGRDAEGNFPVEDLMVEGLENYPYIVFADIDNVIKNYYDVREVAQVNRMVEHIAILLPPDEEEDPVVRREKEK